MLLHEWPAQWAELSSKYSLCGEGFRQSPINLVENSGTNSVGDEKAISRRIGFQYNASPLRIVRQSSISDVLNSGGFFCLLLRLLSVAKETIDALSGFVSSGILVTNI